MSVLFLNVLTTTSPLQLLIKNVYARVIRPTFDDLPTLHMKITVGNQFNS